MLERVWSNLQNSIGTGEILSVNGEKAEKLKTLSGKSGEVGLLTSIVCFKDALLYISIPQIVYIIQTYGLQI